MATHLPKRSRVVVGRLPTASLVAERAPGQHRGDVTLAREDVLAAGPSPLRRQLPVVPRWLRVVAVSVLGLGALVAILLASSLRLTHAPDTGLRLLTTSSAGLTWVDVDSGARSPAVAAASWDLAAVDANAVTVVGSGVVVQYPAADPAFAESVVGYRVGQPPNWWGRQTWWFLLPRRRSGWWSTGGRTTAGGVALASAYGTWRSRVFSLPLG